MLFVAPAEGAKWHIISGTEWELDDFCFVGSFQFSFVPCFHRRNVQTAFLNIIFLNVVQIIQLVFYDKPFAVLSKDYLNELEVGIGLH